MRDETLPTTTAQSACDLLWLVLGSLVLGMAVVACQSLAVWCYG